MTSGFTTLDIMVLLSIGTAGAFGALRGFVVEVFSLAAWVAGIAAVKLFQEPAAALLTAPVGSTGGATLLSFALVFGVAFLLVNLTGTTLGKTARASLLGPVDRVLGFGFGTLKGLIIATLAFLLMSLVFDLFNGAKAPRPEWMTASRTYQLLRASGTALVDTLETVRKR